MIPITSKIDLSNSLIRGRADIATDLSCKRNELRLSEQAIAFALGCAKTTIHNIDAGEKRCDLDYVFRYALYVGLNPFETVFSQDFVNLYMTDRTLDTKIQNKIAELNTQQKLHLLHALEDLVRMAQS